MARAYRYWMTSELRVLREQYPTRPTKDLAQKLNRSMRVIFIMACRLGIVKLVRHKTSRGAQSVIPSMLKDGPKTSAQIAFVLNRSRGSVNCSLCHFKDRGIVKKSARRMVGGKAYLWELA